MPYRREDYHLISAELTQALRPFLARYETAEEATAAMASVIRAEFVAIRFEREQADRKAAIRARKREKERARKVRQGKR